MESNWSEIILEIKKEIPEKYFEPFISPLKFLSSENSIFSIQAPSSSVKEHIEKKYQTQILTAIEKITGKKYELDIFFEENSTYNILQEKYLDDSNLISKYSFENFLTHNSNFKTFTLLFESLEEDFDVNPIYFHGKIGLGKSHLLHAVGNEFKKRFPNKKVKYISMSDFLSEYVFSVQTRTGIEEFRNRFKSYEILLIDDMQNLTSGAEKTQEEFLLLFNYLFDKNRQIIIAADRPIQELTINDKLKSRFLQGFQIEIKSPESNLLEKFISLKSKELSLNLDLNSIQYITLHFNNDFRSILGCLNDLYLHKKTASVLLFDESQIKEIIESRIHRVKNSSRSEEELIDFVSAKYNQTKKDILSKSRKAEFILPRHITMFILFENFKLNKTVIGRLFNTKHTTVISAISKLKARMKLEKDLEKEILSIQNKFSFK